MTDDDYDRALDAHPDDEDPKERRKRVADERTKARYDAMLRAIRPPEDT